MLNNGRSLYLVYLIPVVLLLPCCGVKTPPTPVLPSPPSPLQQEAEKRKQERKEKTEKKVNPAEKAKP